MVENGNQYDNKFERNETKILMKDIVYFRNF